MDDTTTEPTADTAEQTHATTPRAIRHRKTVRRVQKCGELVAMVAWFLAMFETAMYRGVNDSVFALTLVGAIAIMSAASAQFWSEIFSGKFDMPAGNPLRDAAVLTSLLAFVCFWGVCVLTVGFGAALALWASLFNL